MQSLRFSLMTYNLGRPADWQKQSFLQALMVQGSCSHVQAEEIYKRTLSVPLHSEFVSYRHHFLKKFFSERSPDLLCLQEVVTLEEKKWLQEEGLDEGYESLGQELDRQDAWKCETLVAWKKERFHKIKSVPVHYEQASHLDPSIQRRPPNTIVILQDLLTQKTIAVCSTHLAGFNLAFKHAQNQAKKGDEQLEHDLACLCSISESDLCIYAGDLNATRKHYPQRFSLLDRAGFKSDIDHRVATVFDINLKSKKNEGAPKKVKLDHVALKCQEAATVVFAVKEDFLLDPSEDLFLASDHMPLFYEIQIQGV